MSSIRITGMFQKAYPASDDNKKSVSEAIRSLLKRQGAKLEGKIRFSDEGAATFTIVNEDQAKSVIPELKKLEHADVVVVDSAWDLFRASRAAALSQTQF